MNADTNMSSVSVVKNPYRSVGPCCDFSTRTDVGGTLGRVNGPPLTPTESAELYKRIMAQFAREVVARSFEARKRRQRGN